MKKLFISALIVTHVSLFGQFTDLAQTPPMGWNSWNAFALNINSTIVKAVADSMVSKGLRDAGYQYIVIDDGWQIARDNDGKIVVDSTRFPEGIKYLADYVHAKGLKFGIYTCCGTNTCGGRPGSYGYEAIDAQTYADWGVDFIKEDWCYTDGLDTRTQYKIMSDAIKATGRPMVLSLCEWGNSAPWEWANGIGAMWRTTMDIQDCWDCLRDWGGMGWTRILELQVNLAPYAGPGHWNDPDMLEVGNQALNPTECRSHFSMWCMLAAPLIAGNNISTMNNTTRDILSAPEIIAVDQDSLGIQGTRIKNDAGLQVWQKPLKDSSVAVALLNLTDSDADIYVTLNEIGFENGIESSVRDLWERTDLSPITDTFRTHVVSHGVTVVKIKGERLPVTELSFTEDTIEVNQGNHALIQYSVNPLNTNVILNSLNEELVTLTIAGVNTYRLSAKDTGTTEITATTLDGLLTDTCIINILPSNIPAPWKFYEIRNEKASATYENGTFSIESAGSDIWGSLDQFALVSIDTSGNTSISARVISQTNTDPWAKSGLMIRESSAPNSAFVMLCATPGNGLALQWRENTAEQCGNLGLGSFALPVYLKLSKSGSIYRAYKSSDGSSWTLLGSKTLGHPFSEPYLSGMEVLSHNAQLLNLAKFDNVIIDTVEAEVILSTSDIEIESNDTFFTCYPNPVQKDLLYIVLRDNKKPADFKVELTDINGKSVLVKNYHGESSTVQLNITGIPKGIYVLSVTTKKKFGRVKILFS